MRHVQRDAPVRSAVEATFRFPFRRSSFAVLYVHGTCCRHATRDRFVFINLSTFSRHIPTVSVVLSCTHMPIHAMHTPTSRHMTRNGARSAAKRPPRRAQSGTPGRDERDASGRGQASLCATADAHDTGGYTRDAPRTTDATDTPRRAVRPHTRRLDAHSTRPAVARLLWTH